MRSTGGQSDSSILPGGFILPELTWQVISEAAAGLTLGSWHPGEPGAEHNRCFDGRRKDCKLLHESMSYQEKNKGTRKKGERKGGVFTQDPHSSCFLDQLKEKIECEDFHCWSNLEENLPVSIERSSCVPKRVFFISIQINKSINIPSFPVGFNRFFFFFLSTCYFYNCHNITH